MPPNRNPCTAASWCVPPAGRGHRAWPESHHVAALLVPVDPSSTMRSGTCLASPVVGFFNRGQEEGRWGRGTRE
jgi:hypothetical protein